MNKVLSSYAVLMVDNDNQKKFTDNFIPFICECIYNSPKDIISIDQLKIDLMKDYGLEIPSYVINSILRRKLEPQNYIVKRNKKYIPNREELKKLSFTKQRDKALSEYHELINGIMKYVSEKFRLEWTYDDTERYLDQYIRSSNTSDFARERVGLPNPSNSSVNFIIASFLQYSSEKYSPHYATFDSLMKGDMLANAMFLTDLEHLDMKFKNTELFFDTTFIIYALGFAGKARQQPCEELLSVLKEDRAILRCFRNNIEEVRGILEHCKRNLNDGITFDQFGTTQHFMREGYTRSEMDFIIATIEERIEKTLKIQVIDHMIIDRDIVNDENLRSHLSNNMNYRNGSSLDRDLDAIISVLTLRKRKQTHFIENCGALFVTTNESLMINTRKAMNFPSDRIVPPVLTDQILMNLLWLKRPMRIPDLSRKRILADCFAALQPSEYIWKKYIEKLDKLKDVGEISLEDYNLLRFTQESADIMMDKTLGQESAVIFGNIEEIIGETREALTRELKHDNMDKIIEIEKIKEELNAHHEISATKEEGFSKVVHKISKSTTSIIFYGISLILVIIVWIYSDNKFVNLILLIFGLFGFSFTPMLRAMQEYLYKKINVKIHSLFGY